MFAGNRVAGESHDDGGISIHFNDRDASEALHGSAAEWRLQMQSDQLRAAQERLQAQAGPGRHMGMGMHRHGTIGRTNYHDAANFVSLRSARTDSGRLLTALPPAPTVLTLGNEGRWRDDDVGHSDVAMYVSAPSYCTYEQGSGSSMLQPHSPLASELQPSWPMSHSRGFMVATSTSTSTT